MAFTLNAMSIYGQDTRMLDSWYSRTEPNVSLPLAEPQEDHAIRNNTTRCFLLEIPLELRQQVYQYVLPRTLTHSTKGIVWKRASTALLATNSQIHNEASPFLYSDNTFSIEIVYDCATFDCKWILPNGLVPKKRLAFPEQIGPRYVQLLRKLYVTVHHLDQYTGMIKYNFSGSALTDGLRGQVQFLCHRLSTIPTIRHLDIVFKDDTDKPKVSQEVLKPFLGLKNVQNASLEGHVESDFGSMLLSQLNPGSEKKIRLSFSDLPTETRQQIYQVLLDSSYSSQSLAHGGKQATLGFRETSSFLSLLALAYTNRDFYSEIQSFVFSRSRVQLKIACDLSYRLELHGHSNPWSPLMSFPERIYVPVLRDLRWLSIEIAHIPLIPGSAQSQELGLFLDKLIVLLKSAPLKNLTVSYASGKRSSSGESPISSAEQRNSMTSYIRSLDMAGHIIDMRRRTTSQRASPDASRSIAPILINTITNSAPLTSSPTTMDEPSQFPSILIQTPAISYLLSKFNPVFAQVKARKDGQAGFCPYDMPEVSKLSVPDASEFQRPSGSVHAHINANQQDLTTPSSKLRIPKTRAESSQGRESSASRAVIKRDRKGDILFPKVPL